MPRRRSLRTPAASRALALASALAAAASTSACDPGTAPPDALATDAAADAAPRVDSGPPAPVAFTIPAPVMRRLTRSQYHNTLTDVFGEALVLPRALEPDTATEGSVAIGASSTSVSLRGVEQYQTAAYDLAQQLLRDPARRTATLTCTPAGVDDAACATTFVRAVGRRLWRRPLETDEVAALVAVSSSAATTLNDFHRGLEYALAAMLQAPDFLFRAELGEPDPARPGTHRFTSWETASRLAFFLWDSAPDDALLDAAADGSLDTPAGVAAQVDRMLASPRARRGLRAFVNDWLMLGKLDELAKDPLVYPSYAPDLGPSAREEVLRLTEALVFDRDADFRDLITTRETFVNRRLAALYSVPFPVRDAPATLFVPVTLPESTPRRGLLGTAAFLAGRAHPTSTSPTLRGRFIRETLNCATIPSPPVDVNTAIPEPSATARTLRERFSQHVSVASCRGCHALMDPLGLGLEHFDGIGRYRRTDNGVPVDASGEFLGQRWTDALGLTQAVHDDPALPRCVVTRLYRYAQGRAETEGERAEVGRLADYFTWQGHRVRALLREIATSPSFRQTSAVTLAGGM